MKTSLKAKMAANEPVMGTFVFLPSADVVEILAIAGFDFVIIDLEHSPTNSETVLHMVRAAELHGMAPLIRVRENSEKLILQALEMGAEGIVIPFVRSADDVSRAVRSIRYAPEGARGTCTVSRSSKYGTLRRSFLEHTQRTNDRIAIIALIEDMEGINAIQEILSCDPGVDAVLTGRTDLAASMGQMGQKNNAEVIAAAMRIIQAASRNSRPVHAGTGVAVGAPPDESAKWLDAGCRFLTYGTDIDLLYSAATQAKQTFNAAIKLSV